MRLFFTFLLALAVAVLSALAARWLPSVAQPADLAPWVWRLADVGPAALAAVWLSGRLSRWSELLPHAAAAGLGSAVVFGTGLYLHLGMPPLSAVLLDDVRYLAGMWLLFSARWIVWLAILLVGRQWLSRRVAPA